LLGSIEIIQQLFFQCYLWYEEFTTQVGMSS
jgi:hypothetical protein